MTRTNIVRVLPRQGQQRILALLGDRCAALWNAIQYRCRQAFFRGDPVPSYATLCAEFQSHPAYQALPSDIGQEVLKKARTAWHAFFANQRLYREGKLDRPPRPPGYWKDQTTGRRVAKVIPIKSPRSYALDRRALAMTLPADLRQGTGDRLVLRTKGVLRFAGIPKTLELKHAQVTDRWYAHQVVERPDPVVRTARPVKWAGIDVNARIFAALAIEGDGQVRLYRAREVWREFLYWTRRIAEEQARLRRQGLRTSHRLRRLYRTRRLRLKHAFQALARQMARDLRRAGVTHVALEDLTGIREHMDFGPQNLLVHNFWAFRLWRRLLEAALQRAGIAGPEPVDPNGTSSRCCRCGHPVRRPVRHKVVCRPCQMILHADANAAWNILARAAGHEAPSTGDGAEAHALPPAAYRWNRHRWVCAGGESAAATRGTPDASRDLRAV